MAVCDVRHLGDRTLLDDLGPRDRPLYPPRPYGQYKGGFGAMLANLLCGNRNLPSLTDCE
ncbi:hypothetical protein [Streptomyces sp. MZ04]|uniref:hypothetical protein n=1 Tax=Streptomyces sp. MZ04 TaxID=2559236 RepID=UPI00107ECC42|nr:hypothetical protein [Streptomyces sp. MZ04]TGB12109.1 hypothetical protein E2651_12180 [Streptomyces sp. MZ04]